MTARIDADGVLEMLSEVETESDSDDSVYGDLDGGNSDCSSEECDEHGDDSSNNERDNSVNESSDESEGDEQDSIAMRAARGRGTRGRGVRSRRGREATRGRAAVAGARRGRGDGRRGRINKQTPEDLYKWIEVNEGRCSYDKFSFTKYIA